MNLLVLLCIFLFLIISFYTYFYYSSLQIKCESLVVPSKTTVPAVMITNKVNNNKIYLLGDTSNHLYFFMVLNGKISSFYVDFQLGLTVPIFTIGFPSQKIKFQILSKDALPQTTSANLNYPFSKPTNVIASYVNCIRFKNNYYIGFDSVDFSKCIIQSKSNLKTVPNQYTYVFDFSLPSTTPKSFMYAVGNGISCQGYQIQDKKVVYKAIKPHSALDIAPTASTNTVGRITFSNSMYIDGNVNSKFLSFVGNNACVQYNCISLPPVPMIQYWNFKPYIPEMYGSVTLSTLISPSMTAPSMTAPPMTAPPMTAPPMTPPSMTPPSMTPPSMTPPPSPTGLGLYLYSLTVLSECISIVVSEFTVSKHQTKLFRH